MCIGKENFSLIHVDFTRLRNAIRWFTELYIDILTEGITFSLSYSARYFN